MSHDNVLVDVGHGRTFILTGYIVPCSGTVIAWEFCYLITAGTVTFYPGIWRITGTSGNTDYTLVQSNTVTYDQGARGSQGSNTNYPCKIFNLSDTDQFAASAESVVGLYVPGAPRPLLLHTNDDITTHQFNGNQTSVMTTSNSDVNYNIAIRVHLGKN